MYRECIARSIIKMKILIFLPLFCSVVMGNESEKLRKAQREIERETAKEREGETEIAY